MQPAEQSIELAKSRGHAYDLATLLVRRLGVENRARQRRTECAKSAFGLTGRGEIEQGLLRALDLLAGRIVEILAECVVDDLLSEGDQLPPQVEIVNDTAVIGSVDDGDGSLGEASQILRAADISQCAILIEQILERYGIGNLAALDQLADSDEDPAVHRVAEVLGLEEFGNAKIGRVVYQQCAQQRLLGLGIVGCGTNEFGLGGLQRRDP